MEGRNHQVIQGMGHLSQVMVQQDHRDPYRSQDLVTVHPKGQLIMPPPHKDQVTMGPPLLKDQGTRDNQSQVMAEVDQQVVLVGRKQPGQTTALASSN